MAGALQRAHRHHGGTGDHMVVGEDVPVLGKDDPRPLGDPVGAGALNADDGGGIFRIDLLGAQLGPAGGGVEGEDGPVPQRGPLHRGGVLRLLLGQGVDVIGGIGRAAPGEQAVHPQGQERPAPPQQHHQKEAQHPYGPPPDPVGAPGVFGWPAGREGRLLPIRRAKAVALLPSGGEGKLLPGQVGPVKIIVVHATPPARG